MNVVNSKFQIHFFIAAINTFEFSKEETILIILP